MREKHTVIRSGLMSDSDVEAIVPTKYTQNVRDTFTYGMQ